MSKVRIGVVGAGGIAHAHLPQLSKRADAVEMVGVADVNEATAQATAEKYNIQRTVADYHELLPDVDAILVCVPTHLHAPITIDSLKAGKHVFCEKPMARTLEQADAMLETQQSSGKALQIGFVRRFDAEWLAFRDAVQQGKIGRGVVWHHLASGAGPRWAPWFTKEEIGGGPFLDGCIHNIDFALSTFGPAEWAFCHGRTMHAESTAVDTGTATVRFQSGDELMLCWSWGLPEGAGADGAFDLIGPLGSITWPKEPSEDGRRKFVIDGGKGQAKEDVWYPADAITVAFNDQMDEFIEVAQGRKQPRAGGPEGRNALAVSLAILQSARSREVVRL